WRGRGRGRALPRAGQPSRLESAPPVPDPARAPPAAGAVADAVLCERRPPALRSAARSSSALRAGHGPRLRVLLRKPLRPVSERRSHPRGSDRAPGPGVRELQAHGPRGRPERALPGEAVLRATDEPGPFPTSPPDRYAASGARRVAGLGRVLEREANGARGGLRPRRHRVSAGGAAQPAAGDRE